MMRINNKLLIFVGIVLLTLIRITPVYALSWVMKSNQDNVISLEGTCDGSDLKVSLYPQGKKDLAYSAGIKCDNGIFKYSDDLTKWNLKEGDYDIVIDQDTSHKEEITVTNKESPLQPANNTPLSIEKITPDKVFTNSLDSLEGNLDSLTLSLIDIMHQVDKTSYSNSVKLVINYFLNMAADSTKGMRDSLVSIGDVLKNDSVIHGPLLPPEVINETTTSESTETSQTTSSALP
ncbi:MAG TPA: hypothetical protein VLI92_01255 [Candidatus Saccharimonadales bacterium]|nr:hypothetical protein [Candidatus Saccharimonadales bacterium]